MVAAGGRGGGSHPVGGEGGKVAAVVGGIQKHVPRGSECRRLLCGLG